MSRDLPVGLPALTKAGLTAMGEVILQAIGHGKLLPSEAVGILNAIAAQVKVTEIDELKRRVEALEQGTHEP